MVRFVWSAALVLVTIAASAGAVQGQETANDSPRLEKTFLQLSGMG